jgi:TDG/mug DNA glycosylase family protein
VSASLPLRLARLHRATPVGARLELRVRRGPADRLRDIAAGAGYVDACLEPDADSLLLTGTRARTLPDTVGPGMRLLACGLNPSLRAADAGIGFVTPGNRFWPAALAAGLVTVDRDPVHALRQHGIGMTDIVKRATARADELSTAEYRTGLARVERLVAWLRPGAIVFVGLAGWRAAVDRTAVAGPQPAALGGAPVYVMPSTSGLNAACPLPTLVAHLEAAAALAGRRPPRSH